MKKLIFSLSILALTFASCSKEETSLTESNTSTTAFTFKSSSGDNKIDGLYSAMLSSKEYNDYDNARTVFFAKMHFRGIASEIATSEKILGWIENNIGLTEFTSIEEAKLEKNNLDKLFQKNFEANLELYDTISLQPNPPQIWYDLTTVPLQEPEDPCGCLKQLDANLTVSDQYHHEALEDWYYNGVGTLQEVSDCHFAMVQQDFSIYQDCLDNC